MKNLILWGGTGQAKVLAELFFQSEYNIVAVFDNDSNTTPPLANIPLIYGWKGFEEWIKTEDLSNLYYVVAIGGSNGAERIKIHNKLKNVGVIPLSAIHKSAYVANDALLDKGCQILSNATICTKVTLGISCLVNTTASVDHECSLGNGTHIGPGAKLAGCIDVGEYSFIGTGAIVLPRIKIGRNTIIGAGSVVTKDMPDNVVAYGNPAKIVKHNRI